MNNLIDINAIQNNLPSTDSAFLNIIIQSYDEKNQERLNELIFCIVNNLNNPSIKKIYDLTNGFYLPEIITKNPKYENVSHETWITYKCAFDFANKYPNEYFGIINSDILLDYKSPWDSMKNFLDNKFVLAISRHEFDKQKEYAFLDPNFANILHAHTQDGWFFKSPIQVNNCDFEIGLLGCDNAIAHRLVTSGYLLLNKPLQFKLLHVDSARGKDSTNFLQQHQNKKIVNKRPEKEGYYLVPNCDIISNYSVDSLLSQFNFSPVEKYKLICDIFTAKIKINNEINQ